MALSAGTRLGSYEIISAIGAGGMGEVYRARDATLHREVALKTIAPEYIGDADWRRRFEREARLLASLNHPNIATIHGFEAAADVPFLVMELVPGQTLQERLDAGPLAPDEALSVFRQIAAALEVAHDAEIVHRDLKPQNIKITPDAIVKVLDFGVAKSFKDTPTHPTDLATALSPHTREGRVMGTAPYMSPEQARGRPVDERTDIWAFGCVMFETLTGRRAFGGETSTDMVAAVLRGEPDWSSLPADLAVQVRDLLRRCLQKDPAIRLRDARDIRLTIEDVLARPERAGPEAASHTLAGGNRPPMIWAVAGLTLGLVAASLVWWALTRAPQLSPRSVVRFAAPADPAVLFLGQGPAMAISPDGSTIAYVAAQTAARQLYLRRLPELEATAVPGTANAVTPFFSPDGGWVGFFADGKLKKARIGGGEPITLVDAPTSRGGTWTADDRIVFAARPETVVRLFRVSASGGVAEPVVVPGPEASTINMMWPQALPGGEAILFTGWTGSVESSSIMTVSLASGELRTVVKDGTFGRFASSGHVLFARFEGQRNGVLWAAAFDPDRLDARSAPAPIVEDVQVNAGGASQFDVSRDGTLVYVQPRPQPDAVLISVDRKGMAVPLSTRNRPYQSPRVSPDGRRIAVTVYDEKNSADIWIHEIDRDSATRLTFGERIETAPVWSPDGEWIVFSSGKEGSAYLARKRVDGSGTEEQLTTPAADQVAQSWSPDGKWIAFTQQQLGSIDFMVLPLGPTRTPQPVVATAYADRGGVFSPDGRFIAYVSDDSGRNQVFVRQFPDAGRKWQVSNAGGTQPVWSRDGKELFYISGDRLMVAEISTSPEFRAASPGYLFDARFNERGAVSPGRAQYDATPDGRFVFTESSEQRLPDHVLQVVINWFDELKRRVPSAHGAR